MSNFLSPLLNEEDAARLLCCAVGTLRNYRAQGRGPAYVKLGSTVRYRESDLQAYVDARVRRPVPKKVA